MLSYLIWMKHLHGQKKTKTEIAKGQNAIRAVLSNHFDDNSSSICIYHKSFRPLFSTAFVWVGDYYFNPLISKPFHIH